MLNKQIFEIEAGKLIVKNPSEKWVGFSIFFLFLFCFFVFFACFAFVVAVVTIVFLFVSLFFLVDFSF